MAIQPGTHLGPYEILSVIGVGGMGEVYRARGTRLDRIVVINVWTARPFRRELEAIPIFWIERMT
jgi:serine/threonine protein kinase